MSRRRDYIAIAAAIAAQRSREVPEVDVALDALTEDLAEHFGDESDRFDRERFLKAAGAA